MFVITTEGRRIAYITSMFVITSERSKLPTLLISSTHGTSTNVTTVSRQLAENMKTSTITACVALLTKMLRFKLMLSLTVVVSADRRLDSSPAMHDTHTHMAIMMKGTVP